MPDSNTIPTPKAKTLRQDILTFLQEHPKEAFRSHEIAQGLEIEDNETYLRFCDVLAELNANHLVEREGRKYKYKTDTRYRTGILSAHPEGYGFVQAVDTDEEFFIREPHMGEALHGDLVRVAVAARAPEDKKRECEVVEVLERRCDKVVGTFRQRTQFGFVVPDDQRILQDVYVPSDNFNGAKDGDKVVVSIDRFDDRKASPEGRVLRVIGSSDDPEVRVLSLAMSMDVKADFPDEVEAEAAEIPAEIPSSELERRRDLRDKHIFTIDPADAKDFDDAIHVDELENGHYEVGVHVADVSHYVHPDTAIDEEAFERGTSVYLVDRTIPMLPEKLSNQVCSLRPQEEKLSFSILMEVTPHGEVADYELCESVIHSKQRLTYERAQDYIEGGYPDDPTASDVVQANRLAKTLTKKRMREGAIDFGSDEVKVLLDEEGNPQDIVRKKRFRSHRLIEEFMLLANRTVARHVEASEKPEHFHTNGKEDEPRPFVYRIHDTPDSEKIQQLADYVRVFGYELPLTDGNVRAPDLADLIETAKGTPEEQVIVRAALRAMSKAKYAVGNIGHYGLGFDYYTHFTSPIRRYPDLLVHRLLKQYSRQPSGEPPADLEELAEQCEHCSEQERNAEEAERESVTLKQVEYVQHHVGDTFDGVVSGVTRFGVFVELTELLVEGLVHVRDMNDYFTYDESTYTMRGENSGRTYRPGDSVKVEVVGASIEDREIDLLFVE